MTSPIGNIAAQKLGGERNTTVRGDAIGEAGSSGAEQPTDVEQTLIVSYVGACGMGLAPETQANQANYDQANSDGKANGATNHTATVWVAHEGLLTLPFRNGGDTGCAPNIVRGN